jgi:FMN phosphatase YigB (HAD superfamily)/phosphohistidine swiveling domain-containing protein
MKSAPGGPVVSFDFWLTLATEEGLARKTQRVAVIAAFLREKGLTMGGELLAQCLDAEVSGDARTPSSILQGKLAGIDLDLAQPAWEELAILVSEVTLECPPLPAAGAAELLGCLRASGYRLALICNTALTSGATMRELLLRWGWLGWFDELVFSDEVGIAKPDPSIFAYGVPDKDRDRWIHVGDSEQRDVKSAKAAGGRAILSRVLKRAKDRLTMAEAVVYDYAAVPGLVGMLLGGAHGDCTKVADGLPVWGTLVGAQVSIVRGRLQGLPPPGRVVLTGTSSPDYEPLFYDAAAIVTETGGYGSHAAQFAPSVNVACVVGAPGVRGAFREGDVAIVDGRSGGVYRCHE